MPSWVFHSSVASSRRFVAVAAAASVVVIDFVEPAAFRLRAPRVINQSMVRGAAAGPPQICVVWPSPPPREVSLAAAGCLTSCISTSPDGGAFQPLGWRCVDVSLCGCCSLDIPRYYVALRRWRREPGVELEADGRLRAGDSGVGQS